jgi:hypothetical protein
MRFQTSTHAVGLVVLLFASVACTQATPSAASPPSPLQAPAPADDPRSNPTEDYGTIDIFCNPPTPVLVDGKPAGTTPISAFKVTPGQHEVTFLDEETGHRTLDVTATTGAGASLTSDRPIRARDLPAASVATPSRGPRGQ